MDPRLQTYVVEDNLTIRENLIGTLEELACAAVVDLFLKQGSGLGVLQACQARGPTQKVVVLSNYATPDIRRRCAEFGVDAVFDKSNEIDALVDFCLGQASALRASPRAAG